ncbi:hypothetical protein [Natronorubrum tibetense]|nr:hypothetical protein [Natronorubrum tibetense]
MDSKRPDVRLDETPDEEGRVTTRDSKSTEEMSQSLFQQIRSYLRR